MKHYVIEIEGMGCEHCVRSVTEALSLLGADVKRVEIGLAEIAFDGDIKSAKEAIEDRGFDVTAVTQA